MNELVTVSSKQIGRETVQAVDARELWVKLEVVSKFADWIKNRLEEAQAIEGQDFIIILKNEKNSDAGRPFKEYALTLDIAKHIAMLERSEIGRKVRQYFIEVEKKAREEFEKQKAFNITTNVFLIEKFLNPQPEKWVSFMPVEVYETLCKVYGLKNYKAGNFNPCIANLVDRYVYQCMPEAVYTEMKRLNPGGIGRKVKNHQFLKDGLGKEWLKEHVKALIIIAQSVAYDRDKFKKAMNQVFPVKRSAEVLRKDKMCSLQLDWFKDFED